MEGEEVEKSPAAAPAAAICKFYNVGKCRFGNDCLNLHEGSIVTVETSPKVSNKVIKKVKKSQASIESTEAVNKSMKTAYDVIKRIQWDEMIPAEFFTIGYLDRFTGIVEDPFTKFSNWCDLASADYEALAIPQHRIEYFKYRDTKVWDKKTRLDLVFGSAGDNQGKTIEDIMNDIDDRCKEKRLNPDVNDDSDDDDSDDIQVNIDQVQPSRIPEEDRSTHFLAIRISNPDIIKNAQIIQKDIVRQEEALNDCCMGLGLFHVTLGMLRLDGHEGAKEAVEMLEQLKPQLQELCQDLSFKVSGLDTFGQRVLYAKVLPEPEESFWQFTSLVRNAIAKTSDRVHGTDKFELSPHMTLIKVNRQIARFRNSKYLPSVLYESHLDANFGVQKVDNLQLCVLEASTRFDGFYRTLSELKFD